MGILLCCFQIPEYNDESLNVPRIRAFTYPITNNFSPKEISTVADEEDVCPTCFYEYIDENPKIVLQCGHIFHLACIYEWMERSEVCPFCSKTMLFLEGEEITQQVE
ncbi:Zinc finger RING-type [Arabidopsis suecica]|uniref:RING-type E3 ubiquitin transferase n=1 Tax=Arabidopsis suecica TaxID=45249 RepID=A0A8T2HIL3_ARASU|nr:Zinc finger RING-type [Arabidopsis suecica]